MDEYRHELASANKNCARLGIPRGILTIADVMGITGWCRKTVKRYIRFGGSSTRPIITHSQLARQMYELSRCCVEETVR